MSKKTCPWNKKHCSVANVSHAEVSEFSCSSWVNFTTYSYKHTFLEAGVSGTSSPLQVCFAGTNSELKAGQEWMTSAVACAECHPWSASSAEQSYTSRRNTGLPLLQVTSITNAMTACHCPYTSITASSHFIVIIMKKLLLSRSQKCSNIVCIQALGAKEAWLGLAGPGIESEEPTLLVTLPFMLSTQTHHFLHLAVSCWRQKTAEFMYMLTDVTYILPFPFKFPKNARQWRDDSALLPTRLSMA